MRPIETSDTFLWHAGDVYQLPREMQDAAREVRARPCQASPCVLQGINCTAHWPHSHVDGSSC